MSNNLRSQPLDLEFRSPFTDPLSLLGYLPTDLLSLIIFLVNLSIREVDLEPTFDLAYQAFYWLWCVNIPLGDGRSHPEKSSIHGLAFSLFHLPSYQLLALKEMYRKLSMLNGHTCQANAITLGVDQLTIKLSHHHPQSKPYFVTMK